MISKDIEFPKGVMTRRFESKLTFHVFPTISVLALSMLSKLDCLADIVRGFYPVLLFFHTKIDPNHPSPFLG